MPEAPVKHGRGYALDKERAIRLYQDGLSMAEIGRRLGHGHGLVSYHLHRSGVLIRKLNPSVKLVCPVCSKEFFVYPCRVRRTKAKSIYCSQKCRGIGHRGPGSPRWIEKHITGDGYVHIYRPDDSRSNKNNRGMFLEHRIAMEEFLGRRLEGKEVVHHINGIKTDNRIENLSLSNKRFHQQSHIKTLREISKLKKENQDLRLLLALFFVMKQRGRKSIDRHK